MKKTILTKGLATFLTLALILTGPAGGGLGANATADDSTPQATEQTTDGTTSQDGTNETPSVDSTDAASGSAITVTTPTINARGGSKRVRITWQKVADADGYYIYYRSEDQTAYTKATTITDKNTLEYVKKSLTQNKTYYFRVSAYKNAGSEVVESELSTEVSAKTEKVSKTSKVAKKYKGKSKFTKSPAYTKYKQMKSQMNYSKSFAIPGMKNTNVAGFACTTMVPQAICYAGNYLLISAYDKKGVDYSVIYVVSKSSKSYITTIVLPSKANVGGMAYDGTNIWISKGGSVASFPYTVITNAINAGSAYTELAAYSSTCKVNTTSSYIGYYNNTLWVGAFSQSKSTMYGYTIQNKTAAPTLTQTYSMQVPSKVQGITFSSDGMLTITRGYRTKTTQSGYVSQIRTYVPSYDNVGKNGKIKKNSVLSKIKMPPKVEGVTIYGSYTYVLFSSCQYSGCKYPVDRVIAMKTPKHYS